MDHVQTSVIHIVKDGVDRRKSPPRRPRSQNRKPQAASRNAAVVFTVRGGMAVSGYARHVTNRRRVLPSAPPVEACACEGMWCGASGGSAGASTATTSQREEPEVTIWQRHGEAMRWEAERRCRRYFTCAMVRGMPVPSSSHVGCVRTSLAMEWRKCPHHPWQPTICRHTQP